MMLTPLSVSIGIVPIRLRYDPLSGSCEDGVRPCCEPMGNEDYEEKDGGARLEEVWHTSIGEDSELRDVMRAMGLSSA
jgi:hypothetical protein